MTNTSIIDRRHFAFAVGVACFVAGMATAVGVSSQPAFNVGQSLGLIGAGVGIGAGLLGVAWRRYSRHARQPVPSACTEAA